LASSMPIGAAITAVAVLFITSDKVMVRITSRVSTTVGEKLAVADLRVGRRGVAQLQDQHVGRPVDFVI